MGYCVVNRLTGQLIVHQNSPLETCEYDSAYWLINPELPAGVDQSHYKVVGDAVVEMTTEEKAAAFNPPEPMADRHAREQREGYGVTLANDWVMRWTERDQTRMGTAKDIADLLRDAGSNAPLVPFYDVNGIKHLVTYTEAYQILGEYMALVMIQQARQEQELLNG